MILEDGESERRWKAYNEAGGNAVQAAQALGIKPATMQAWVAYQKSRAERGISQVSDFSQHVPAGHFLKNLTSLVDTASGKARLVWTKSSPKQEEQYKAAEAAAEALAKRLPRYKPIPALDNYEDDLVNLYTLTDCHIGMLAWEKESGENWDLRIAESTIIGAFQQMIAASPSARQCLINQLGDFLHFDGLLPITPTSRHVLDADGRFGKLVDVAARVLRAIIDMALQHHEKVTLLLAEGNHDIASSVWLRAMFKALYENEPRLDVIDSEMPYYCHQHGDVMLGFHHGHLAKNETLPPIFAAEFARVWGSTTKRYIHTGDKHHRDEKEHRGATVIQHGTLAARTSYESRLGYSSMRNARAITYHCNLGEVSTQTVWPRGR